MNVKEYYNPEVARIVGELISDGHMQTDNRYLISFYSKDFHTIKWFEKRMNEIFNVDSWIFQDKRSPRYKLFIKSKKILTNFEIPSSPLRLKKGNIRKDGSKSVGIRFEIEKKGFKNFYKYINFHNKSKRGKLIKALGL